MYQLLPAKNQLIVYRSAFRFRLGNVHHFSGGTGKNAGTRANHILTLCRQTLALQVNVSDAGLKPRFRKFCLDLFISHKAEHSTIDSFLCRIGRTTTTTLDRFGLAGTRRLGSGGDFDSSVFVVFHWICFLFVLAGIVASNDTINNGGMNATKNISFVKNKFSAI